MSLTNPGSTGLLFGAVAHRANDHLPGNGWVERSDTSRGSTGSAASLAVVDAALPMLPDSPGLYGSFNSSVHWAANAVLLRPAYGTLLSLSTAGHGSVALSPTGGDYPTGTIVALQAVPQPG